MDTKAFAFSFALVAIGTTAFPFLSGLVHFGIRPFYLKIFCLFCGASFTVDLITALFTHNNYPGNFFRLIEFAMYLFIFYNALGISRMRAPFISAFIAYLLLFAINLLFVQKEKLHTYAAMASAVVFIGLSLYFFYGLMKNLSARLIQRLPMFWIASGLFFYFSGTFTLFMIYDYLTQNLTDANLRRLFFVWNFHSLFLAIANMLFGVAFWLKASKEAT